MHQKMSNTKTKTCEKYKKKLAFVNVLQERKMQREDRNISCKCCSCLLSAMEKLKCISTCRKLIGARYLNKGYNIWPMPELMQNLTLH